MKRAVSIVLAAAMAVSMFAGCGAKAPATESSSAAAGAASAASAATPATPAAPAGKPIKIAVAAPMTGDNAEYGKGFLNAANMKAEEWNAKGGVLGSPIEIVAYDDKNSSEEAASIAQKIVSEGDIAGVIGHFSSGVCMTAAPTYQENKIIEISPSASHPDYSGIGDYIFRNNTVISVEAAAALDIATTDLGKKNIGIISIKTDWGTNTSKVVKDLVEAKKDSGAKIVAHEEVMEGSDDYSPAITKLNAAGADVVICVGMYSLLAPVAKQYKQINPDIAIVGFSNAYSQQLLELGGSAVEGVRFPVIFFSGSEDFAIKDYVTGYTEKFGAAPSALTSQAYDSVGMLLEAIQAAGTTDSEKVKVELFKLDYPGVAGQTKFDENGDVQKSFVKVTVKDGKFAEVK
ncbi:ABC transporter substrate-binding protein [Oscillospiraceae bacterium PP1C4]